MEVQHTVTCSKHCSCLDTGEYSLFKVSKFQAFVEDIIIIVIISFMRGIYTYIPETNYIPREYSVAAILMLLFMVLISLVSVFNLLYFHISTFRCMRAVPNMVVFCSSLASCFSGMLLTYFLNYFERAPVAPITTGITFVFYIPHALSLLFLLLSSSSSSSSLRIYLSHS